MPRILIRPHDAMRHLERLEQFTVTGHERIKALQIFLAHCGWGDDPSRAALQVLKNLWFLKRKLQFVRIQRLKDNHLMPVKPQLFEPQRNFLRRLEQIREKKNDAAPMNQSHSMFQQPGKAIATGRIEPLELPQNQPELVRPL